MAGKPWSKASSKWLFICSTKSGPLQPVRIDPAVFCSRNCFARSIAWPLLNSFKGANVTSVQTFRWMIITLGVGSA